MPKKDDQQTIDDAPDFVKEAEANKAETEQTVEQPPEAEDKDEIIDLPAQTPQEKSQAMTKVLIKDQAINYFLENASSIINATSKINNEEGRRLVFLALNRAEIAMQEKGIAWSQINQRKLVSGLANVALLGLDAEQGEVYPIPYAEKGGKYNINFQRGYKGERKIRLKHAIRPIEDMDVRLIREGDTFKVHTTAEGDTFEFEADPFNEGKVKGAFAWILRKDKTIKVKVLTVADIEKRKKASMTKMGGNLSPAWKLWENEMILAKTLMSVAKDVPIEIKDRVIEDAYENTDYETVDVLELPDDTTPRIALPANTGFKVGKEDIK